MTQSWLDLPVGRVAYLPGMAAEAIELSLTPLPEGAPAVVTYRPGVERRTVDMVEAMLAELDRICVQLFPAWLPAAEYLEGPGGGGIAAVHALALERAASTAHFGPFLADLAQRSLSRGGRAGTRFAPEVRAAELAKVIAASYRRTSTAILVDVPPETSVEHRQVLGSACEWFARHGHVGIWLTGAKPAMSGVVATVDYQLPEHLEEIVSNSPEPERRALVPGGTITYPPVAGRPRSDSAAETALEAGLAAVPWAIGRVWNRAYAGRPQYIVDLMWSVERCAIEVDGDEHRSRIKFENDRRRDVLLQTDGVTVLRFTNRQVLEEIEYVLSHIEKIIKSRRTQLQEMK